MLEIFLPVPVTLLMKVPVVVPSVLTCPAELWPFTELLTELEVLRMRMTLKGAEDATARPDAEETVESDARKLELFPLTATALLVFARLTPLLEMAPLA